MSAAVKGALTWSASRDEEGQRSYVVMWHVVASSTNDGPGVAGSATGLSAIGSSWPPAGIASANDSDAFAICLPTMTIKQVVKNEPGFHWHVTQTFSTKPIDRCQTDSVENPLAEPDKISGGFSKYTRNATQDKDGAPLQMSNFEKVRGIEVDYNRPTVRIERNIKPLGLATFAPLVDSVNSTTTFGLSARKVKLSNVSWEKRFYGTCTAYYNIVYEFDINFDTFDVKVEDMGFNVLDPGGTATNPLHYDVAIGTRSQQPTTVPLALDGAGKLKADGVPFLHTFKLYPEADLVTALDLPTTL